LEKKSGNMEFLAMAGGPLPQAAAAAAMPGSLQTTLGQPGQPKPEDLNHPCQEQLPELKYSINDNPPWRMYIALCFLS
jgi:hypothetical protein